MSFSETISPLLGRLALAWFFLSEAYMRATQWDANVQLMSFAHVPAPPLVLAVAIIVLGLGGLALLFGYHARHGAMLLFGLVVVAVFFMHDYWSLKNVSERASEYEVFALNVAIAGGLLMVIGLGAGPFALDNATGKPKRR
ncbi:MAG TPA: DoxX family protein [Rhizomicrobium sp.]|nr:DoxX family protein [Rhizomicrobium sp.]